MFSIIIPTYNEEEKIGELIRHLRESAGSREIEILVIDGGSSDHTIEEARKAGAKAMISPQKGRAHQMNYGARQAGGKWLYFLHADTIPPDSFVEDMRRAIENGANSGCFRLAFDMEHWALKLYAWFTRFDVDLFRFGDQSLFVEKAVFEEIGGFDESLIVMEDQEIVRRIKRYSQFRLIPKAVVTSGRRYERIGFFKLQLIFTIIVLLYYLGVQQETIVKFYRSQMISNAY
ncbi:TIGR04283 family arsenosugar biosynthesis glycosyltransferase [Gracilimonas sp. Q87]|uniref:TIGR04283 family arsenosugar biosynthesis glycosyltransferase n=1 Tax=Gracilimonas sp. Q87 TaxID=3384766 RepID=UPI003984176B